VHQTLSVRRGGPLGHSHSDADRPVSRRSGSAPGPPASVIPATATGSDRLTLDPERDQNYQQRKLDFLSQPADRNIYNPHAPPDPVSPYEVLAGTVISASLLTGLNSDLQAL
jgi:type IV secretory pathway VirB10-like protein